MSDPPHREVDHDAVAELLGLPADAVRLKVGFSAPEVLRASDLHRATTFAQLLKEAGVSVVVFEGEELARVPWPTPVTSLAFDRTGLLTRFQDRQVEVPYDSPVVGVYCKPPADFKLRKAALIETGSEGLAIAEAIESMPVLDLYFARAGRPERVSIVEGVAGFSGLGGLQGATPAEDLAATVAECGRRFTNILLDTRLDGVRPRRRFVAGQAGFDMDLRKNYSFGTLLLRHALGSISPELKDLTHYEFGSRLGYVLSRGKLR